MDPKQDKQFTKKEFKTAYEKLRESSYTHSESLLDRRKEAETVFNDSKRRGSYMDSNELEKIRKETLHNYSNEHDPNKKEVLRQKLDRINKMEKM